MRFGALAIAVALGGVLSNGCSSSDQSNSAPSGTGGNSTSGGTTSAGTGTTGGGGTTNVGVTSGGTSATGGAAPSTGGASMSGVAGSSAGGGGTSNTGTGRVANAGAAGTAASGGATAAGGMTAAGGTTSTGGATSGGGGKACHSTEDWTPKSDDIWISPSGSDSSAGTEASPKKTLTAAISAWAAGKTIWVTAGTYPSSAAINIATKATSTGPLRISGVTGGAKPVFDFSSEPRATNNDGLRGFQISGAYVHLRYLEVAKASDNGVYVTGSNDTIEWLSVHECQDTGVQVSNGAASNKLLNIDSYLNSDPTGENADGFAAKFSIGQGNYFCGTRSYQNSDDGYDCWSAGNDSPVTFEYCWAFGQPGPTGTANSDGNGFKLGNPTSLAAGGNAAHKLISCFSFDNRAAGFTSNGNNSGKITCTNCGVWGDGVAWSPGTGGVAPQHTGDITNLTVTVDRAMNAPRDANGDLPDITKL